MTGPTRPPASPAPPGGDAAIDAWLAALDARHRQPWRPPEFLKAVRALSARYVERRGDLPRRSPIDSPGKRAAFAGFYAPLHFLLVDHLLRATGAAQANVGRVLDLGCGTGVAGAAWARLTGAAVHGVDRDAWALDEARWNWRALGVRGRAERGDLVAALGRMSGRRDAPASAPAPGSTAAPGATAFVAAWALNELPADARTRAFAGLLDAARRGAPVLVVEPIARGAAPWWDAWARACVDAGGRADEWTFDDALPASLATISDAAGFGPRRLAARATWIARQPDERPRSSPRAG